MKRLKVFANEGCAEQKKKHCPDKRSKYVRLIKISLRIIEQRLRVGVYGARKEGRWHCGKFTRECVICAREISPRRRDHNMQRVQFIPYTRAHVFNCAPHAFRARLWKLTLFQSLFYYVFLVVAGTFLRSWGCMSYIHFCVGGLSYLLGNE